MALAGWDDCTNPGISIYYSEVHHFSLDYIFNRNVFWTQHNCVLWRHIFRQRAILKRKYFRENVVIETERLQSLFVMKINWLQRQYIFRRAVTLGWRGQNERMHLGKGNSCDLIYRMWNVYGFIACVDRYIDFCSLICVPMWWMVNRHCLEFHIDDRQWQRKREIFLDKNQQPLHRKPTIRVVNFSFKF